MNVKGRIGLNLVNKVELALMKKKNIYRFFKNGSAEFDRLIEQRHQLMIKLLNCLILFKDSDIA